MLSDKSTHNSIVLSAWLKDTNLVPKEELVEEFHKKTAREQLATVTNSDDADMLVDSAVGCYERFGPARDS